MVAPEEGQPFTTTPTADVDSLSDILDYLHACYGELTGRAHAAVGLGPHLLQTDDGKYKYEHKDWRQDHCAYPADAEALAAALAERANAGADVYVCPYLMWADKRAQGAAVARILVHADVDCRCDPQTVRALGGFAVASGTPGQAHVYVPLSVGVTAVQHRELCRALGERLGAKDAKISDNDLLRPPGTFNHKPTCTGGDPAPVTWLIRPNGERRDPQELAGELGVALPLGLNGNGTAPVAAGNLSSPPGAPEPVDLTNYPTVQAALDLVTGEDRSKDTMRVVGACYNARLPLDQTRWVVNSNAYLAERLAGRNDDDVLNCWLKVVDDRLNVKWSEPPANNGQAAPEDTPSDSPGDTGNDVTKHSGHLGMAVKMAKQFAGKLLYVHGYGWHRWDGKRWAPDGNGSARRAVHAVIKRDRKIIKKLELPVEEEEKRLKQIARYETASAISGILTEAAVLEPFSVELSDIDADPWLFNCQTGTLDLRTMECRPHNPADLITKIANAAYRADSIGTHWHEFVQKVLPDANVRSYTQRLTGLSLLGEVNGDKQIAPIATGSGANGKTTYTEAVSFALGDYAMPAEPTLLMAKRGDAHPAGIADLLGKRFVSVVETEQGRRFDIALLKWLTGGDELKARFMRQNFFRFKASHLLWLATNHLPRIDDDTEAVWRRIRVIPFTVEIPKAERDKHLKDRLCAEADAVLGWVIDGWKDYRRRGGLDEPGAVLIATNDYKDESDAVGRFIADECDTGGAQSSATTKALYERWQRWAAQDGSLPLSMIAFGRALDAKGYSVDQKDHYRRRRRICLRSAENEERAGQ